MGGLRIESIYIRLAEQIHQLIPFDRFTMSLIETENETARLTWEVGTDVVGPNLGYTVPMAGSLAGEAVLTKSAILLEVESSADLEPKFSMLLENFNAGLRSFLAVPLLSNDVVIGVIRVGSKNRGAYSQRHLDLFGRIGNQIMGAVASARIYADLQRSEELERRRRTELEVRYTLA